jgi:hypothetical protein
MPPAGAGDNVRYMVLAPFQTVEEAARRDAYLTDGIDLYRVVRPLDEPPRVETADLENCWTLAVHTYTADELWRMGLRIVRLPDG